MSKTVAEYYAILEEMEKKRKDEHRILADLKKAEEEKKDAAHRKEEAEQIERHAYGRRAAEKPWLVTIIASAGCLGGIAYFLLRLFNANESMEVDRMTRVCIFLGVIILLLIGLGFFRSWLKKKELAAKQSVIDGIVVERKEADKAAAVAAEAVSAQAKKCSAADKEYSKTEDELFTVHPEEKERLESEKKAEIERQIKEKAEQEEAYTQMLEDREKRSQELQLAGEMFDMPKKFLREYGGSEMAVYEASAEMGCEEAQCKVVQLYVGAEYMTGVKQDLEKGLSLGKKYAGNKKIGSPMVAELMGELYLFGKGSVQKDPEKAIFWLTQAASCGRKNAMVNLGYSLYTGEGVEQDVEKAKFWFEKAAKQGDEQAFKLLEAIKSGAIIRTDGDDYDEE